MSRHHKSLLIITVKHYNKSVKQLSRSWLKVEHELVLSTKFNSMPLSARQLYVVLMTYCNQQNKDTVEISPTILAGNMGLRGNHLTEALAALVTYEYISMEHPNCSHPTSETYPKRSHPTSETYPSDIPTVAKPHPSCVDVPPNISDSLDSASALDPLSKLVSKEGRKGVGVVGKNLELHPTQQQVLRFKNPEAQSEFKKAFKDLKLLALVRFIPEVTQQFDGELPQFIAFVAQVQSSKKYQELPDMAAKRNYLAYIIKSNLGKIPERDRENSRD